MRILISLGHNDERLVQLVADRDDRVDLLDEQVKLLTHLRRVNSTDSHVAFAILLSPEAVA